VLNQRGVKTRDQRAFSARAGWVAVVLCALVFSTSCQLLDPSKEANVPTSQPPGSRTNAAAHTFGYALLYELLGDEKDVAKLRFIKRPRAGITDLLKEISRVTGDAHKQLERYGKNDHTLDLKYNGLPTAEVMTREAIGKSKAKALLSSKGKQLEIQILLTQENALGYGAHLAKTVALGETEPQRQQFLNQLSETLSRLGQQVVSVLDRHYTFNEDK
jgi:hypothetical protein